MEPTLIAGDKLYINKISKNISRGDIVVLLPEFDKRLYIKRVIATENDDIYIDFEKGEVYINDKLINEPYIKSLTFLSEKYIKNLMENGDYSKQNPIKVSQGHVFLMGDNRLKSYDSRGFGLVKTTDIKGKAIFRIWPAKKIGCIN